RRAADPRPQRLCAPEVGADGQGGRQGPEERPQGHRPQRGGAGRAGRQPAGKGTVLRGEVRAGVPRSQWGEIGLADEAAMAEVEAIGKQYEDAKKSLERRFVDKVEKLQRGDELPPGVMKMVKVFVAVKRKIQPGDKMAGRHGNKGVVSMI